MGNLGEVQPELRASEPLRSGLQRRGKLLAEFYCFLEGAGGLGAAKGTGAKGKGMQV